MKRETVLECKVDIRDHIVDLPDVQRLCEGLKIEGQRVEVDNCELYCEVEGEGTPLVLLHGGPGSTHHDFHPYFSRAKCFSQVVYYDQRGCGLSDYVCGKGYTISQAVDDLHALRKALGFDQWIVLGHSYGGFLAQCYAVTYPEQIAGLVLVGSSIPAPVDLNSSRAYDFMSDEERARIQGIQQQKDLSSVQRIFNKHLNGDWKRQNFHKPSLEKHARRALYGWQHDTGFNGIMNRDARKIDLRGAFETCPIPTLIVEGEWDLTWNTDKPEKLHALHPNAELRIFEHSGHSPFEDESDLFFQLLGDFVRAVIDIEENKISRWQADLSAWRAETEQSLAYTIQTSGWGHRSNKKMAHLYTEDVLDEIKDSGVFLKLGCALYDCEAYESALHVFEKMAEAADDNAWLSLALIWQGHMLDLLCKRDEAIAAYQKVIPLGVTETWQHSQFGLAYSPVHYAEERLREPFERVENLEAD